MQLLAYLCSHILVMLFYHLPLILFFTERFFCCKLVDFTEKIRIFLSWRLYNSMITIQLWSLGAKQPDKLYGNHFLIRIDLEWLLHLKGVKFLFSKSFFYVKFVYFFIEEYKLRRRTFINDAFWLFSFLKHSIFWNRTQFLACSNQFK